MSLFAESIFPSSSPFTSGSGVFFGSTPPTITNRVVSPDTELTEPLAQNGGQIQRQDRRQHRQLDHLRLGGPEPVGSGAVVHRRLAGTFALKRTNVFPYNSPGNLFLPRGKINLKFEGTVDNSASPLLADGAPVNAAFFASASSASRKGPGASISDRAVPAVRGPDDVPQRPERPEGRVQGGPHPQRSQGPPQGPAVRSIRQEEERMIDRGGPPARRSTLCGEGPGRRCRDGTSRPGT